MLEAEEKLDQAMRESQQLARDRKRRFGWVGMTAASYLADVVFLVLFCVAETIPARVPAAYGAGAATIVAVHYWAYASGWSLKFRDPNLVLPLMVAGYSSGDTVAQLLHRADVALYDAKRTGRDRVVVA